MSVNILGFGRKIYTMVDGLSESIGWNDLLYLITVYKLVRKLQRPINAYMFSHYSGKDLRVGITILRRMFDRGYIIEVSKGTHNDRLYKDSVYGEHLLKRYSIFMERFLNGKITDLS